MAPSPGSRFVVVSGGPGAGKTTLLDELAQRGHAVVEEAGRAIIRDQRRIGGPGQHTVDAALFAELMLSWEMRSYRSAESDPAPFVFFDRGIPEIAGYFKLLGLPLPAHVDTAASMFAYRRTVFLAPPWPAIYGHDEERTQTPDEARATYEAVRWAYQHYGYETVDLPLTSAQVRADAVLSTLGA